MADLQIQNLCKYFNDVKAVDGISLEVKDGEFLTFLGPSGCGKSTTLFAIAGLDTPTHGKITLDGKVLFDAGRGISVAPEKRDLGLVFQSYALWPHLTVGENLAFPLKLRKIKGPERTVRIRDALELVEMSDFVDRYPHEMSGGQQQRVALARTLVYEPKLLLLDEPLSNLDAKLRIKARSWLKSLQSKVGLTTIYVTHDQSEALSLSDRIAVIAGGKLAQLDTPEKIYRSPGSSFVADFVGASNFVEGTISETNGNRARVDLTNGAVISAVSNGGLNAGDRVDVTVRPEHIQFVNGSGAPNGFNVLSGSVLNREYLGSRYQYLIGFGEAELRMESERDLDPGDIQIGFDPNNCHVFSRREGNER